MADLSGFDARNVEQMGESTPLPEGEYLAVMASAERKTIKKGTGDMLECKFQVVKGEQNGRTFKSFLNLWHNKDDVREIAQKELSSICHAVNVMVPRDTSALCGIPMIVKLALGKPNEAGKVFNEIKAYKPRMKPAADSAPAEPVASEPEAENKAGWMDDQKQDDF
jgi:hypothetical protein